MAVQKKGNGGEKRVGQKSSIFEQNARRVTIESLNQKISGQLFSEIKEQREEGKVSSGEEEVLAKYEKYVDSGKQVQVVFEACDDAGNFTAYEGGVLIVLPGSSVLRAQGGTDVYNTARIVGTKLSLCVSKVDRENAKVYCEVPQRMVWKGLSTVKNAINREIRERLSEGKKPVVWGRVKDVKARRAFVDILDQGILGIIDVSHWQMCYTRSLIGMCQEGEYYQFEIDKQAPKMKGKDAAWLLNRRNLTADVWKNIDYDSLKEGGTIVVKCIEKVPGKTYWWGQSDRLPGIEVMGDYTVKFASDGYLLEGIRYKCKIKEINVSGNYKDNRFKVIPFAVLPEDTAKLDAVRMLRNKTQ